MSLIEQMPNSLIKHVGLTSPAKPDKHVIDSWLNCQWSFYKIHITYELLLSYYNAFDNFLSIL